MNWNSFSDSQLVADLGWTLVHSLWQIGLAAGVLCVGLRVLRGFSTNARYVASVAVLALAAALPVITFVDISLGGRSFSRLAAVEMDGAEGLARATKTYERSEAPAITARDNTAISGEAIDGGSFSAVSEYLTARLPQILPFAVAFWIAGLMFFSIRFGGGLWQLRRYRMVGVDEPDDEWSTRFTEICESIGMNQTVAILRSTIVETPVALGFLRPVIIVPASAFLQISPAQLETIIAHELIHIRRFDPIVNAVQNVIETILFYHPAIWWMSSQIRREREFAADAGVLEIFEGSHTLYASALANLEEIRFTAKRRVPRYATAADGGNLMQRIQKILNIKTEVNRANSAWTAGLALLLTSAVLLAVFSFSSAGLVNAQRTAKGRKLAIGFVSIPPLDRTNAQKDSEETMRLLIHALKVNKVPATGFLQGGMISDGERMLPEQAKVARMWIDAGYEVGLGGFRHIWLSHTPVDEYIANIEKSETVAKKLLGDMGSPPRYFSYPYLNTGNTTEDKNKVESWLASRGYTSVKYTLDNQEWMYSFAYEMARLKNDEKAMNDVRAAYLGYLSKMFDHYEAYSSEMFGRDIAQTMVLTPSRLVVDTADDFFAMAAKRGYSYVTVDEAQSDPAYKTPENFVGAAGISWFERWSFAAGKRLRTEPDVDSSVEQVWKRTEG